jgi:hypothetical protein
LLTFGAATASAGTAPGQLSVQDMIDLYHVDALTPETAVHLHVCASEAVAQAIVEQNSSVVPGKAIFLPVVVPSQDVMPLADGLRACLPRLTLTIDPTLAEAG